MGSPSSSTSTSTSTASTEACWLPLPLPAPLSFFTDEPVLGFFLGAAFLLPTALLPPEFVRLITPGAGLLPRFPACRGPTPCCCCCCCCCSCCCCCCC